MCTLQIQRSPGEDYDDDDGCDDDGGNDGGGGDDDDDDDGGGGSGGGSGGGGGGGHDDGGNDGGAYDNGGEQINGYLANFFIVYFIELLGAPKQDYPHRKGPTSSYEAERKSRTPPIICNSKGFPNSLSTIAGKGSFPRQISSDS